MLNKKKKKKKTNELSSLKEFFSIFFSIFVCWVKFNSDIELLDFFNINESLIAYWKCHLLL